MKIFNRFVRDESGATAVEYSLIAALMAVVLVVAVPALANAIGAAFGVITRHLGTLR